MPRRGGRAPLAGARVEPRRRRVARRVQRVLAGGQLDRQVDGRHEPLVGGPAAQVGVGGGQELLPRHRAEHAAERTGQQQRPGRGVHALARHVDERHLERLAVAVGDHEVAAERGAARRAEHHGGPPAVAELGQRALGADAVAQLDHHPVRAQPPGAELAPGVGQHVREVGGGGDRHHDARARLVQDDVVERGPPPRSPTRIRSARGHSSRPPHRIGRIITPGENQPLGHVRGDDRDADGDHGQDDRDPAVPGDDLPPDLVGQPLPGNAHRARARRRCERGAGTIMTWRRLSADRCRSHVGPVAPFGCHRLRRKPRAIENHSHPAGRAGYEDHHGRPVSDPPDYRRVSTRAFRLVHEHAFNGGPLAGARLRAASCGSSRRTGRSPPSTPRCPTAPGPSAPRACTACGWPCLARCCRSRASPPSRCCPPTAARHPALAHAPPARPTSPRAATSRSRRCGPRRRPLYGRYGYGRATTQRVPSGSAGARARSSAVAPVDPALTLRLADPQAAAAELAKVYDTCSPASPGFFTRDDDWWDRVLYDPEEDHGAGPAALPARRGRLRGTRLRPVRSRRALGRATAPARRPARSSGSSSPPTRRPARRSGRTCSTGTWSTAVTARPAARRRPGAVPAARPAPGPARGWPTGCGCGSSTCPPRCPAARTPARSTWCSRSPTSCCRATRAAGGCAPTGRTGAPAASGRAEPADVALDVRELGAAYLGGTRLGTLAAAGLVTRAPAGHARAAVRRHDLGSGPVVPAYLLTRTGSAHTRCHGRS